MAKSLVSYLLGHALCEGKIGSVEDTVQKYLKVTSGTPWGNKTLRQMINMQAGNAGNLFVKAHKTILETAEKVQTFTPRDAQTGPARRNDQLSMQNHLNLLKKEKYIALYKLLSDAIKEVYEEKL